MEGKDDRLTPTLQNIFVKYPELILKFHSFLSISELCVLVGVCKWWKELLRGEKRVKELWEKVSLSTCAPHATTDGAILSLVTHHPEIQLLDLKFCSKISDQALVDISKRLKGLRKLDVEGCGRKLGDLGVQALVSCTNLQHLNVNGCQRITPATLERLLVSCRHLDELCIGGLSNLEDKNLQRFMALAPPPRLTRIVLNGASKITDHGLAFISATCGTSLREIEVAYCANISDDGLVHLASRCPNLTHLNLYGCTKVTDVTLNALGTYSSKLQRMDLSMCRGITEKGIRALLEGKAKCGETLESLNLFDCASINSAAVTLIGKKCPKLKFLGIYGCDGVEGAAVVSLLRDTGKHLEKLDCGGCTKLSNEILEPFFKRYPHLFS